MMVEKFTVNTYDSALRYFRHIGRLEQMAKKWALWGLCSAMMLGSSIII
jgi:hypothetical protein